MNAINIAYVSNVLRHQILLLSNSRSNYTFPWAPVIATRLVSISNRNLLVFANSTALFFEIFIKSNKYLC